MQLDPAPFCVLRNGLSPLTHPQALSCPFSATLSSGCFVLKFLGLSVTFRALEDVYPGDPPSGTHMPLHSTYVKVSGSRHTGSGVRVTALALRTRAGKRCAGRGIQANAEHCSCHRGPRVGSLHSDFSGFPKEESMPSTATG